MGRSFFTCISRTCHTKNYARGFYFTNGAHIYEQRNIIWNGQIPQQESRRRRCWYKSVICAVCPHGRFGTEVIMYQKEIIYLGLYKDGDRLGNAGFLKVEKRDKEGCLSLVVKNVPHSINGKYPVRYYSGSGWKETDDITVREGVGQWEKKEPGSLEQIRLQVILPGGYLVEGASRQAASQSAAEPGIRLTNVEPEELGAGERERDLREQSGAGTPKTELAAVPRRESGAGEEPEKHADGVAVELAVRQSEEAAVIEPAMSVPEPAMLQKPQEIERIAVQRQERRETASAPEQAQKPLMADALVIEGLKEDKWEQILDTYENIHPYGDGRVCVKLEPKDFIIMSGKYQHLVNNSFLLHGFYNYRHVILEKEGETYYLGVPGVFYEREKMVALMFGFEAFECESGHPKAGEFGYYLRKVEL